MSYLVWPRYAHSIESMTGSGCFRFSIKLPNSDEPEQSVIVAGLSTSPSVSTHPNGIEHGVMVKGREFRVVENGLPVTAWETIPDSFGGVGEVVTFRIYRYRDDVWYTKSLTPRDLYDTDYWKEATKPSWDGEDKDDYASASSNTGSPPPMYCLDTKGDTVYISTKKSYGAASLDAVFSRDSGDEYGEEAKGSIYGARLLPIFGLTAFDRDSGVRATMPAISARASNVEINSVFARMPFLTVSASDLSGNRVRASMPMITASASSSNIFEIAGNSIRATIPVLRAERPELKSRPIKIPILKVKATGENFVQATLPALSSRCGDSLNLALLRLPFLKTSSTGFTEPVGLAYGDVIVPMSFVVEFNGRSGDAPPTGANTPPMVTRALVGELGGDISAFMYSELLTDAMTCVLGGSIGILLEAALQTADMVGLLGGEISAQVESILYAEPMTLTLGGTIGGEASSAQDVVLWGDVAGFDAANEVFCASAEDDSLGGTTQYKGFAFNSCAKIGDHYYGANENGLFLLGGNTDDEQKIAAKFGFGQIDFGNPKIKTIAYCYLGTSAGAMKMSVDALLNGQPTTFTYQARGHGRSMREIRFDLGRGLRSTYVMPTFYNFNGDDFEVDTVRFLIAESTRRI